MRAEQQRYVLYLTLVTLAASVRKADGCSLCASGCPTLAPAH